VNYAELCDVYGKYKSRGLEVLAFPCNQFGGQEPGTNAEVKAFATSKCPNDTFNLFAKSDVNGDNATPLYVYLKKALPRGFPLGDDVLWNFEKFLVDRTGKPVKRFNPQESPSSFEDKILELL